MNTIADSAQRLADRLRMAADEIESAARYDIPIPFCVTVSGHEYSGLSFAATEDEFTAWAEYVEGEVRDYEYDGAPWSAVERVDVNGLPVSFFTRHEHAAVTR